MMQLTAKGARSPVAAATANPAARLAAHRASPTLLMGCCSAEAGIAMREPNVETKGISLSPLMFVLQIMQNFEQLFEIESFRAGARHQLARHLRQPPPPLRL